MKSVEKSLQLQKKSSQKILQDRCLNLIHAKQFGLDFSIVLHVLFVLIFLIGFDSILGFFRWFRAHTLQSFDFRQKKPPVSALIVSFFTQQSSYRKIGASKHIRAIESLSLAVLLVVRQLFISGEKQ